MYSQNTDSKREETQCSPTAINGTPFEELNQRFEKLNYGLSDLLDNLEATGHRLSNTNIPKGDTMSKECMPETPFKEGNLMQFYIQLNRMEMNLVRLQDQVSKFNSLI